MPTTVEDQSIGCRPIGFTPCDPPSTLVPNAQSIALNDYCESANADSPIVCELAEGICRCKYHGVLAVGPKRTIQDGDIQTCAQLLWFEGATDLLNSLRGVAASGNGKQDRESVRSQPHFLGMRPNVRVKLRPTGLQGPAMQMMSSSALRGLAKLLVVSLNDGLGRAMWHGGGV